QSSAIEILGEKGKVWDDIQVVSGFLLGGKDGFLAREGPSNTKDTKIAALRLKFNAFKALEGEKVNGTFTRLKCLLNNLENNSVSISQAEVNATFVNSLPRKWLSMNQTQKANNSIKNDSLATMYGKYNYEEGLIDQIYESKSTRFFIQASSSKALISNTYLQDNDSDVEEDTRSSSEFLADLNAEFHERVLLANQKRYYKRSGRIGSAKKPIDKTKETCFACGLKAEIDVLTKKINAMSKGKSKKGLVAESFEWDEESVSYEDERVTKVKTFMAIIEDEPSVGKADARSGQWVKITLKKIARLNLENESQRDEIFDLKKVIEKWTSSKVTLDRLLTEQVPGNIVRALGGRGKRKQQISSKEVLFTKADECPTETDPEITFDSESECDIQESLPPLPKLLEAEPTSTSTNVLTPTDLTQTSVVSEEIKKGSSLRKAPMILKPFRDCKYYDFNDHHSDECEYCPGCDICDSIAHETTNCTKKTSSIKRKPRIANSGYSRHMTGVKQYLHRYSKELGTKVVFGDNSLGEIEGYGSVKYNGITFIMVAYVNGLKHNLINIVQLCDANFKVLFTKTQGTIFNQNNEVVLISPIRRDVYVIDMSSYNEESNACFFAKASSSVNWL
ncbi:hypothetical protein Tco_0304487, partial [Tanacetum coccineum]